LDDFFNANDSTPIFEMCIEFLDQVPHLVDSDSFVEVKEAIFEKSNELFRAAEERGILLPETYIKWALLGGERENEILAKASIKYPNSEALQLHNLEAKLRNAHFDELKGMIKSIHSLTIQCHLDRITSSFGERLFTICNDIDKLIAILKKLYAHSHISILSIQLDKFFEGLSIDRNVVRDLFTFIKEKRGCSAELYQAWISCELILKTIDVNMIRSLFLKATALYSANVTLWNDFIKFERDQKCYSEASRVHRMALRVISDPTLLA
jgi:hypothetical protein